MLDFVHGMPLSKPGRRQVGNRHVIADRDDDHFFFGALNGTADRAPYGSDARAGSVRAPISAKLQTFLSSFDAAPRFHSCDS